MVLDDAEYDVISAVFKNEKHNEETKTLYDILETNLFNAYPGFNELRILLKNPRDYNQTVNQTFIYR